MIVASTLASSGLTSSSRSSLVFDGTICSSGTGFAGAGQPVGDQRQVGDLQQFLEPDAGVAQRLDDRPAPERVVLGAGEVRSATPVASSVGMDRVRTGRWRGATRR